jgi:hypothetical protein
MQSWKKVWREAAEPLFSVADLQILHEALVNDDPRLLQGATTTPPPLQSVQDWPVEAACLLAYPGAIRLGGFAGGERHCKPAAEDEPLAATVGEVEEFFAKMCFAIDTALGELAGCRWLINWFDSSPREEMRRELLGEVERSLILRLREEPVQ